MANFGWSRRVSRCAAVALTIVIGGPLVAASPVHAVTCSLTCPADIVANTQDPAGLVVNYDQPMAGVGCTTTQQTSGLPSGDVFPPGTTRVGFRDQNDIAATCTFDVTITFFDGKTAPVLDFGALIALAVVLAGFGFWSARRRAG